MRDADFTLVQDLSCLPDKWSSAMGVHKKHTGRLLNTPPAWSHPKVLIQYIGFRNIPLMSKRCDI